MRKHIPVLIIAATVLIILSFFGMRFSRMAQKASTPLFPFQTKKIKPTDSQNGTTEFYTPPPSETIVTPTVSQQINIKTPSPIQSNTQSVSGDSCRDGAIVHQNVKSCSDDLSCGPFTPMNARYCRLPDGTCKFFCDEK